LYFGGFVLQTPHNAGLAACGDSVEVGSLSAVTAVAGTPAGFSVSSGASEAIAEE
jgi:hypothetical protein